MQPIVGRSARLKFNDYDLRFAVPKAKVETVVKKILRLQSICRSLYNAPLFGFRFNAASPHPLEGVHHFSRGRQEGNSMSETIG